MRHELRLVDYSGVEDVGGVGYLQVLDLSGQAGIACGVELPQHLLLLGGNIQLERSRHVGCCC
jgi:hypothetical protein